MSEARSACARFDEWLLEGAASLPEEWATHVSGCAGCRSQWEAHQALAMAFSSEAIPELTLGFDQRLARALATEPEVSRPLRGWRSVAMWAYLVTGAAGLWWLLPPVALPPLRLSSEWSFVALLVAVPVSLSAAVALSRWLPARGTRLDRSLS